MPDRRWKDYQWSVVTPDGKHYEQANNAQLLAVLMDLRDELKAMKGVLFAVSNKLSALECPNFLAIPRKLDRIGRNTAKKRKQVVGKPKLRVVR